jgi:hypothetical protein
MKDALSEVLVFPFLMIALAGLLLWKNKKPKSYNKLGI